MQTKDLTFTLDQIEDLFPCEGEEGQDVKPTMAATARAAAELNVQWQEITWHAPDVFAIRYGSSWVASAFDKAGNKVRFHSDEGDFKEGDDKM